ncbi:MAG: FliH/SctL family protein [Thermaurantiacus sp.]
MSDAWAGDRQNKAPPLAALLGIRAHPQAADLPPPDCSAEVAAAVAVAVTETESRIAADAESYWLAEMERREAEWRLRAAAVEARADATLRAAAEQLGELIMGALRAVLGATPTLPPDALASLGAEALAAFADHGAGTLRLSPDDAARVELAVPDGWTIATDSTLPAGEVHAEVGAGVAMARIEHRLACLARGLAEGLQE